jgi:uncharacterized membrane protein YedE/YeeE
MIAIPLKDLGRGVRYALGGTLFGLDWALTGSCPGPLFALPGNGVTLIIAAMGSVLAGWVAETATPAPMDRNTCYLLQPN